MKIIQLFLEISSQLECKCVLTGSTALRIYGLVDGEPSNDLDIIIINPSDQDKLKLANMEKLCPNEKFKRLKYLKESTWEVSYQMTFGEINVDVFTEKGDVKYLHYDHFGKFIPINPLMSILDAKKRLNRSKDWETIFDIAKKVNSGFNIKDFTNFKRDSEGMPGA